MMSLLKKIQQRLYGWYGKRTVIAATAAILILTATGVYFSLRSDTEETVLEPIKKEVTVRAVSELSSGTQFSAVGVVAAVSEARLLTESGGRVTGVSVGIGDRVAAGAILAQIENASERAALLQAEGAYEAALVGGTQASIGLTEARTNALNTYRNSFTVADDVIRNTTDELFNNPTETSIGLRIDGQGQAPRLNAERRALGIILENWGINVSAANDIDTAEALTIAESDLVRISTFVSDLSALLAEQEVNTVFTTESISSYKARLSASRSRIDGTVQAISVARNTLLQAEQSASGGATTSEADARIKQALGALRSAQASYEKTLVRSPIAGVVSAFYLKANEYVGPSVPAAVIVSEGGLEIETSISDKDRESIGIGDPVAVGGVEAGTVTRVAPAVDPTTGKIEVRIGVNEGAVLRSGDTVSLTFTRRADAAVAGPLLVPIAAFKITAEGPVAFTVQDGVLVPQNVVLGAISGDSVLVRSGLSPEMRIVTDARGLKVGESVLVKEK